MDTAAPLRATTDQLPLIRQQLLADPLFLTPLRALLYPPSAASDLNALIEEVRQLLQEMIRWQLEHELKEMIEINNRILQEINDNMLQKITPAPLYRIAQDASLSKIHRIMDEERRKPKEDSCEPSEDKSISAFVELKVETMEEAVESLEKRLKTMEDKYETNLKSIWNVLSITEGAVFDHLKQCRQQERVEETERKGEEGKEGTGREGAGREGRLFGLFRLGR